MASQLSEFDLRPDEFAFRFGTDGGVDVEHLATFLYRVVTVARRADTQLVVVGIPDGSVIVKLRAVAKKATKEFNKAPIAGTAAMIGIVGGVAGIGPTVVAIVNAMMPSYGNVTPMAKAGAVLIEDHHIEKIEVITNSQTIVVMDRELAARIRMLEAHRKASRRQEKPYAQTEIGDSGSLPRMAVEAREGALSGKIIDVEGELHFRPDGYRYLVPVDTQSPAYGRIGAGLHIRVQGKIAARRGQPDRIVIDLAWPL